MLEIFSKLYVVASDPGGANLLRDLLICNPDITGKASVHRIDCARTFHDFHSEFIAGPGPILLGTSLSAETEKKVLEVAENLQAKVFLVIDDIYNVKNRVKNIGTLSRAVTSIGYLEGTPENEKFPNVPGFVFTHPICDAKVSAQWRDAFPYIYNPSGPILVVDEYKESFELEGRETLPAGYLSDYLIDFDAVDIECRRHPRAKSRKSDYTAGDVRLIVGYSSNYLLNDVISDIPFVSVAGRHVSSLSLHLCNQIPNMPRKGLGEIDVSLLHNDKRIQKRDTRSHHRLFWNELYRKN